MKFRGIEISIVSQFDIRRLPEFAARTSPAFDPTATRCYIPIYFGSQVWFEYRIDGPHPPGAAYLFKLSINNEAITSWDCTAKSGYHGKTTYSLHHAPGGNTGLCNRFQRSGFKFSNLRDDQRDSDMTEGDDCIQLRVYRIQHRQRLRTAFEITDAVQLGQGFEGNFRLINGGIVEPGLPQRRYKYQLLDPRDKPYASFCFYYRTFEWLKQNDYLSTTWADESFTSSSAACSDQSPSPPQQEAKPENDAETEGKPQGLALSSGLTCVIEPPLDAVLHAPVSESMSEVGNLCRQTDHETYIPLSSSEESLRIITKDSIEDLQSLSSRSPQSPKRDVSSLRGGRKGQESLSGLSQSPRRRLKKSLTLNLNRHDIGHNGEGLIRPLSPFNGGGLLRDMLNSSSVPVSAPAAVTEFGPSVDDEVKISAQVETRGVRPSTHCRRTTRATRKGLSLISFLGRRTAR